MSGCHSCACPAHQTSMHWYHKTPLTYCKKVCAECAHRHGGSSRDSACLHVAGIHPELIEPAEKEHSIHWAVPDL